MFIFKPEQYVKQCSILLLLASILTSCSVLRTVGVLPDSPASELPYTVSVILDANAEANSGNSGLPSPIRLRLFLIEPEIDLLSEPFETVFEFDGTQPSVKPEEIIMIAPGESRIVQLEGMKSQVHLVVAAAFQNVHSSVWIAEKIIDTGNSGTNTVSIGATSIEIQ